MYSQKVASISTWAEVMICTDVLQDIAAPARAITRRHLHSYLPERPQAIPQGLAKSSWRRVRFARHSIGPRPA
jgi:hypothetical protein